jgi:hypothetical protein
MYKSFIVFGFAIALSVGCTQNKSHKHPTTQPLASAVEENTCAETSTERAAAAESASTEAPAAPAPAVATDNLAGAWSLAMPRQTTQHATIIATDANHVTIDAAGELSGDYFVHGNYLLILTHDARLRSLAWKINSPDSLTIVRSSETADGGTDYTGVTLVRAPSDSTASTEDESQANTDDLSEE